MKSTQRICRVRILKPTVMRDGYSGKAVDVSPGDVLDVLEEDAAVGAQNGRGTGPNLVILTKPQLRAF